ncbi:AI-2E family transporter [Piscinibacter sakaiensis]|uniref:AI-2E family transporter n=1 Tax=Piscinibacter sakaiensis TaxID=1547922 RepID=A0A0K8P0L6_PISS1|nr:AI-2E family transporter [Piscinibacter sakaiensis]GAP36166.1 hypothetical protein ISF6_2006 [Piscinibacter sakaiensis]
MSDPPSGRRGVDGGRSDAPGASRFAGRLLAAAGLVVALVLAWLLARLLVLLFAAIVLAVALRALADLLQRRFHVGGRWSVAAAVLVVLLGLGLVGAFAGDAIVGQLDALRERMAGLPETLRAWLDGSPAGRRLLDLWRTSSSDELPLAQMLGVAGNTLTALGGLSLMLILAVYLAAAPQLYRDGAVRLLPLPWRGRCGAALDDCAGALRGWLKGQAISMCFVGAATAVALWALGVPLALAVGLLAGLLAFVPFFGAIVGGGLAVMVAFLEDPGKALYVAALSVAIQQVEGNLLMPFVQRWAVSLPPVLGILASVLFGTLLGPIGIFFATPLMVVTMVLVQRLYIEDFLEARAREAPSP